MTWGERIMAFGGILTGCAATVTFLGGWIKEEMRDNGGYLDDRKPPISPALRRTSFWAGAFTVVGLATVSLGAFVFYVLEGGVS